MSTLISACPNSFNLVVLINYSVLDAVFVLTFNLSQSEMMKTQTDFLQMIQARLRKSEEITASVELSKVRMFVSFMILRNFMTEMFVSVVSVMSQNSNFPNLSNTVEGVCSTICHQVCCG